MAGIPRLRISASSSLPSAANVTMPSMSAGVSPASRMAASDASAASCSSLRPEFFENSVCPMPAIAASFFSERVAISGLRRNELREHDAIVELDERHLHRKVVADVVGIDPLEV